MQTDANEKGRIPADRDVNRRAPLFHKFCWTYIMSVGSVHEVKNSGAWIRASLRLNIKNFFI